ncbi:MAG TPA: hypothetical protein DCM28_17945 [Phycisphaerales bacterium]|nr:hypothetical protein [Phycisphaerales bacterium]|tara:strand:+ start:1375 stop:1929 length:555 start_codon:yes stop_codon:yes gene_type:complete
MDRTQATSALKQTGKLLQESGHRDTVIVILGGSVAAMSVANMPATRVTHDCDVLVSEPNDQWQVVQAASQQIAKQNGLPENWLNHDSRMYAHLLPIGWRSRCEEVGTFGPLHVLAISRLDLMAMKLMGTPVRPQDLEDILAMKPTKDDLKFLHQHLDRLDEESYTRETHDNERAILKELEESDG